MFTYIAKMLTNHANAYLYCKSIQNKSNTATIYQKITYFLRYITNTYKNTTFNTNIQRFA